MNESEEMLRFTHAYLCVCMSTSSCMYVYVCVCEYVSVYGYVDGGVSGCRYAYVSE